MDDNRRRLKRHGLSVNIEVHSKADACAIGKLVNIHHQGLMIMSNRQFNSEQVYELQLVLDEGGNQQTIPLSADCLWQSPANSDGCFWVGFKIVELSQLSERAIVAIIEQYTEQ